MFNAGVPEKVIQERTGHLSLVGLRTYERPSIEQHITAGQVIAAKHNTPFQVAFKHDTPFQTYRRSEDITTSPPAPGQFAFSNFTVNFYQNIGDKRGPPVLSKETLPPK